MNIVLLGIKFLSCTLMIQFTNGYFPGTVLLTTLHFRIAPIN